MKNKNDSVMLEIDDKNLKFEINRKENVVKKGGWWKGLLALPLLATVICGHMENTEARLPKEIAYAVIPGLLQLANIDAEKLLPKNKDQIKVSSTCITILTGKPITLELLSKAEIPPTEPLAVDVEFTLEQIYKIGISVEQLIDHGIVSEVKVSASFVRKLTGQPITLNLLNKAAIPPTQPIVVDKEFTLTQLKQMGIEFEPILAATDVIASLIYTEVGNQEIVNWARSNRVHTPPPVTGLIAATLNSTDPNSIPHAVALMELAFPCYTGTLTAYMHHAAKSLGYWVRQTRNPAICEHFLRGDLSSLPMIKVGSASFTKMAKPLDELLKKLPPPVAKLISVLFTVEILDTLEEVNAGLGLSVPNAVRSFGNQYTHRPIPNSATCPEHSDCIETTIKHLLAMLCGTAANSLVNTKNLPVPIASYFDVNNSISGGSMNAGEMNIEKHKLWSSAIGRCLPAAAVEPNVWGLAKSLGILALTNHYPILPQLLEQLQNSDSRSYDTSILSRGKHQQNLDNDKGKLAALIKYALCALSGTPEINIDVEVSLWDSGNRLNDIWPTEKIVIKDTKEGIRKQITIGTGGCKINDDQERVPAEGVHAEIIKIEDL